MNRSVGATAAILILCAACTSGDPGGATGAAGTSATGAAGTTATGAAGSAPGTGAAGTSATGAAGTTAATGAAGTSAAAGSVGSSGAAGVTGAAGTGAAAGTNGGNADGGAAGTSAGGVDAGALGNKVLLFTRSTGFVHGSTKIAAAEIARKAMVAGLVTEISEDPAKFATPASLAQYGGIVLIATAGEPFGSPGTTQVQNLLAWVRGGGGLVGIENCNHAYDNNADYVALMGGDFNGHGAGMDTCTKDGVHPTTKNLPDSFQLNDEWYNFTQFRMDNLVVLRCTATKKPISWVREEGSGRFFYTALGHNDSEWTTPPLVDGHVLPGLLWAMKRPVP